MFRGAVCWGILSMVISTGTLVAAPPFKPEQYKEVQLKALETQPEEYKNKKVCYTSRFQKAMTTFPAYAERNGIKVGKYFWLLIPPLRLPVVVKKSDEVNALVLALKAGMEVKVYGKVRKFSVPPERAMLPRYYLDLIHLEVVALGGDAEKGGDKGGDEGGDANLRPKRPVKRPPKRRPR